jgi:hypothetical protein
MKNNIHDTQSVAIFARKNYSTDKTQWVLRMSRHGDRTPEADAVEFRWGGSQNWFASASDLELWLSCIKTGKKIIIRTDRVTNLIQFLERIEPASVNKGASILVHTDESAEAI